MATKGDVQLLITFDHKMKITGKKKDLGSKKKCMGRNKSRGQRLQHIKGIEMYICRVYRDTYDNYIANNATGTRSK